jgi:hypothetical protein
LREQPGIAAGQRKGLARKLEELQASQRSTAKALGVGETRVARDLGKSRGAPSGAPKDDTPHGRAESGDSSAQSGAPSQFDIPGGRVAQTAQRQAGRQSGDNRTASLNAQFYSNP